MTRIKTRWRHWSLDSLTARPMQAKSKIYQEKR